MSSQGLTAQSAGVDWNRICILTDELRGLVSGSDLLEAYYAVLTSLRDFALIQHNARKSSSRNASTNRLNSVASGIASSFSLNCMKEYSLGNPATPLIPTDLSAFPRPSIVIQEESSAPSPLSSFYSGSSRQSPIRSSTTRDSPHATSESTVLFDINVYLYLTREEAASRRDVERNEREMRFIIQRQMRSDRMEISGASDRGRRASSVNQRSPVRHSVFEESPTTTVIPPRSSSVVSSARGSLREVPGFPNLIHTLAKNSPALQVLDLSGCYLPVDQLDSICAVLHRNDAVHTLRLDRCGLQDDSCDLITQMLKSNKGLITVSLRYNQLTDAGALNLYVAVQQTSLDRVYLDGNSISEWILEQIKQAVAKRRK